MIFTSMPDGSLYFNGMLYVRSRSLCFHSATTLNHLFFSLFFNLLYATSSKLITVMQCIYAINESKLVMCFVVVPKSRVEWSDGGKSVGKSAASYCLTSRHK